MKKPVMKDGKRQSRRERTLARLEKYLAGGVRTIKPVGKESVVVGPFTPQDIERISYDIKVLKERLGKTTNQTFAEKLYEHSGA